MSELIENQPFYLDRIKVDVTALTLSIPDEESVSLQHKPVEVLTYLAKHYPRLVSRQELIDAVWAGNKYVGEKALTNAVWQLRHQMQQFGVPDCIVTVRKKGYRLDIPPHQVPENQAKDAEQPRQAAERLDLEGRTKKRWRQLNPWPLVGVVLVLGLVVWLLLPTQHASAPLMEQPGWQLEAITQGDGRAMFPALSKDERWLAFSWQKIDQAANLYLADLSQPTAFKQLTFDENHVGAMVWSADGRYLYYSDRAPVDGVCSIKQLDVVTLRNEPLTSCSRHSRVYLDISPDGRYLLFSGPANDTGESMYQLDLQNSEAEPEALACSRYCEARVRDVAFSPDGTQLLLTRRFHRLSEELFLRDLRTGKEQQLTFGEEDIIGISWHPSGEKVVYGALHHGQRQGFVLELTSGHVTNLGLDDFGGQSRFAADGSLFFHSMSSSPQLAYLPVAPQLVSALFPLTASDHRFESPDYHRQREALIYISNESGFSEIWMADAFMQNRQQLTFLQSRVKYPSWSHSGEQVLFVARLPGDDRDTLTILDVATGKLTTLPTEMRWHVRPSWWYDDSAVIFSAERNLYRFDLADHSLQQLTFHGGNYAYMDSSERILFTKGRNLGLWQLSPDGQEQQVLNGEEFTTSYAWSVYHGGLYFLQQRAEMLVLRHLDWEHGEITDRIQLSPEQVDVHNRISYAPELQRLYLEMSQQPRVDIMALSHALLAITGEGMPPQRGAP